MTKRTMVAGAIGLAATMAGTAPVLAQMHPGGGHAGSGHEVAINDVGYNPGDMVVAPGQQVTWVNNGANPHTVTSDDGATFNSGTMMPKGKFELTAPAAKGAYTYHCTLHTYMRGTLTVSTLTLQGPKRVLVGKTATIRGTAPGMPAGTPVVIESHARGSWSELATAPLAANGSYRVKTRALKTGLEVRARVGAELSPTIEVPVAPRVTVKKAKGEERTIEVTVKPARAGKAKLERLNTNTFKWSRVRQFNVSRSGKATVKAPKAGRYRVTTLEVPKRGQAEASSRTLNFSSQ